MKKPQQLRDHLLAAVAELQRDPDRLLIFVDEGKIRSTMANGLSFEYEYTLTLVLTDYAGDLAAVSVPLLAWLRQHQSDLLVNLDKVKTGIQFEAEILANDKVDLIIKIPLTERVIVKEQDDNITVDYPEEPHYNKVEPSQTVSVYYQNQILAQWRTAEAEQHYSLDMPLPERSDGRN